MHSSSKLECNQPGVQLVGMQPYHQAIAQGDQSIDPRIRRFVAVFEYMTIIRPRSDQLKNFIFMIQRIIDNKNEKNNYCFSWKKIVSISVKSYGIMIVEARLFPE
jgi:hypothetical protein